MKIAVVHGAMHKGSTYHTAQIFLERLGGEITEFFLPGNFSEPCKGCFSCFVNGEHTCPHAGQVKPIMEAFEEADLIVLDSPVYVLGMTGQLKCFLDHTGYRFMVHRPDPGMFFKTGLVISTAGGYGTKQANKAMKSCLSGICIPKVFSFGESVFAMNWEQVTDRKKKQIEKKAAKVAKKVKRNVASSKPPGLFTKFMFLMMRKMQKNNKWLPLDREYWEERGWLGRNCPWKRS